MVESCPKWPKTKKRDFVQTRTRAEGLETFQMVLYRSRNVFERRTAGRNDLGGRELVDMVKNSNMVKTARVNVMEGSSRVRNRCLLVGKVFRGNIEFANVEIEGEMRVK